MGLAIPYDAYLSAIKRLPEVHKRLIGVQTEELDFREIFKRYDTPDTFFYLDPPYVHSTRKTTNDYEHEMTDRDHEELVELTAGSEGQSNVVGLREPHLRGVWRRRGGTSTSLRSSATTLLVAQRMHFSRTVRAGEKNPALKRFGSITDSLVQ